MEQAGVPPTEELYVRLTQVYIKRSDIDGARGVMAEMKDAGVPCGAFTYTVLTSYLE